MIGLPKGAKARTHSWRSILPLLLILAVAACGSEDGVPDDSSPPAPALSTDAAGPEGVGAPEGPIPPEQDAFWARWLPHCGKAYSGAISDVTPYYRDGVVGREMVMHVLECGEGRIHAAFHIDDNRSRNWILTRVGGTIRLKHDHRHEDGTEEEITQYGGDAPVPGLPHRQIFPADAHTAGILPDRADNFWFFDFLDDETLQYGVHWPRFGHSIRIEFDLSTEVPVPPLPWGYEHLGGAEGG